MIIGRENTELAKGGHEDAKKHENTTPKSANKLNENSPESGSVGIRTRETLPRRGRTIPAGAQDPLLAAGHRVGVVGDVVAVALAHAAASEAVRYRYVLVLAAMQSLVRRVVAEEIPLRAVYAQAVQEASPLERRDGTVDGGGIRARSIA